MRGHPFRPERMRRTGGRSSIHPAEGHHLHDVAVVVGQGTGRGDVRHRLRRLCDKRLAEDCAVLGRQSETALLTSSVSASAT